MLGGGPSLVRRGPTPTGGQRYEPTVRSGRMKLVTLRLVPEGTAINPVEQAIADEPGVSREVMHHIRALDDGTGTLLCEFSGDADRLDAVLASHPDVIDYSVAETDGALFAYVHEEFRGEVGRLLDLKAEFEIIVDEPMEYLADGSVRVSVVGELATIQAAAEAIPDSIEVVVERVGDFHPGAERLFSQLTDRQQETVRAATRLGYFRDPRGATYEDVAEAVGVGPETVGEHLRKAQATVFEAITPVE